MTGGGPATIFHVTHYKAGSQWVNRILMALAPDRVVTPEVESNHFLRRPIVPGGVYPTVYVTREQFEAVQVPRNSRRIVVIRDLRDTLVSAYFSLRSSHAQMHPWITETRQTLQQASVEDGMFWLCGPWLRVTADIQRSWVAAREPLVRYEDLLTDDLGILERELVGRCRMRVTRERLKEVVLANRFATRTQGRNRGTEDLESHERKGIAGDWKNHFTDKIAKVVKKRYGDLLVATGYEKDNTW
jgi:lipopolysaccharide transport system ATP-binding protein